MQEWWERIACLQAQLGSMKTQINTHALIEDGACLTGPLEIGPGTKVCRGASVHGPVRIGRDCMIGNNSFIRGPAIIGNEVRVGFSTEIKNAIIEDGVMIGPLCFVADSVVHARAFLGALVRTSNFMLTKETVKVYSGEVVDTGLEKLGACIGEEASLGIGVVILPGRIVAARTIIGPRVIVDKNLPAGRYVLKQELDAQYQVEASQARPEQGTDSEL